MSEQVQSRIISADIVVIGGGTAGIAFVASLLKREPNLSITVIEPRDKHYYQPAWTLVGAGIHDLRNTMRPMASVMPRQAIWLQTAVSHVDPENHLLTLDDGRCVGYQYLIVCPGLRLAWEKIEGLQETLGQHGVTSNYSHKHAGYTWQLVKSLSGGKAIFTQPGMPIKCAGAPQKALYLSCDHWRRHGTLKHLDVEFNLAGAALFGVADFVPALMKYIEEYRAQLVFNSQLVKVDGPSQTAWFAAKDAAGAVMLQAKRFDFLHVVPPQVAPDFIRESALANADGWCEVHPHSLQHVRYPNVFGLGDVCSTGNAKTAAAVRKQVVVAVENVLALRKQQPFPRQYDGYGACPLTVQKGKVILAEFGYAGKLLPTFPLEPTVARRLGWYLKASFLPWFYWHGMLKGREWLTRTSKVE